MSKLAENDRVTTDWKTAVVLITTAIGIGVMWNDLKRDIKDIEHSSSNCAQTSDFVRFGTQLQGDNPSIRVPKPEEYLHGIQQLTRNNER